MCSWLCVVHGAFSQTAASSTLGSTTGDGLDSVIADLKDAKTQADVLNKALNALDSSNLAPAWLKALHIQFKTFEPTSPDKNAALGFDYSYDKSVTNLHVFGEENPGYLSFNIKANGNVAFDKNDNPADFLQSGVQFHLWQLFGLSVQDSGSIDEAKAFNKATQEFAASGKTWDELKNGPEGRKFVTEFFAGDPPNFFYDAVGNASFESNQSFSKKQWACGGEVHVIYRDWNPTSTVSKMNVFDWPFALTRMLGGDSFEPQGRYVPGIMVGLDLIDPVTDPDRFKIDHDKNPYPRFKAEVGFRSKVLEIENKPIWFNASYRYFQEINASSAIRAANMDVDHYFAASLDLLWNVSITYSVGKLPFDLKNQQVWALGYNLKF